MTQDVRGERRANEGNEEQADDIDGAGKRELVLPEAEPDALPVATRGYRNGLVVLLVELGAKEVAFDPGLEVRMQRAAGRERVRLRDTLLALALAAFNGVFGCCAQRLERSI